MMYFKTKEYVNSNDIFNCNISLLLEYEGLYYGQGMAVPHDGEEIELAEFEAAVNAVNRPKVEPQPNTIAELKEMQLIQMEAQAEIFEQSQNDTLILFSALAEMAETIEELRQEIKTNYQMSSKKGEKN